MKRIGMVMLVGCLVASAAFGTALTANRDTHTRTGELVSMLVETNVTIYAGAMVCENGSSRCVPASDTSGYAVIGRAESAVDTVGDTTATKYVNVRRGVFLWANGDSFTSANVGDLAYVEDDQTVQKAASATYDIVAGIVIEVVSTGVWVDTYAIGGQGAASVTTLNASGAAVLGSTLSVAGTATLSGAATVGTTLDVAGAGTIGGTLGVTGALTARIPVRTPVTQATTNRTCTSADYGKVIVLSTNAAIAVTLPANGAAAGSYIDFMVTGTDACAPTVAAATTDTLVGPNDPDLKSVTYGTGHRIGAYLRVISDGSYWHAINLGTTTMTGND